jgi:hypothetical protein
LNGRLAILILHRMGDPRSWRTAVRDLELMLPTCAPQHEYIVHAAEMPLPDYIKDFRFDGIVLGPTFLCSRFEPRLFEQVRREYAFIRDSDAFTIALPQDDYDCHAILDRWLIDWRVNSVTSVFGPETWPVLYPLNSASGHLRGGYTGYVSDAWIDDWHNPRPFESRTIDVSYRARKLPPNFGRVGDLKGVIGERFAAQPAVAGLRLDLSTDPNDVIAGAEWHAFLENSRFCLTTGSGSSLLDPEGQIRACVERHLVRHPEASFEEIEAHCFSGEDGKHVLTALAPRHIEAALACTVQIGTPADYSGILEPGTHYIRLEPDCSNAAEVVATMGDRRRVAAIASACKSAILDRPDLRATTCASQLIQLIAEGAPVSDPRASADETRRLASRYRADADAWGASFWKRQRAKTKLRAAAVALGARRIKRFFSTSAS